MNQQSDNPICPSCGTENTIAAKICTFCNTHLFLDPGKPLGVTEIHAPIEFELSSDDELIANRYQIVRELGRGGMGVVYYVKDTKLENEEMALKMISPFLVKSPEVLKRFTREVLTVRELQHKDIVRVFHLDEFEGAHFFTMEYLSGRSLREMMNVRKANGKRFSLEETAKIVMPILSALVHAHQKGVIHRDLKPENVIIEGDFPDIQIKVLDFGLAKVMSLSRLTSSALSMGTAYYMSPEQLAGKEDVDERTDLFAVGVILYELLTGEIPSGMFELPTKIIKNLPEGVDALIKKALANNVKSRISKAQIFYAAMDQLVAEQTKVVETEAERQNEPEQVKVVKNNEQKTDLRKATARAEYKNQKNHIEANLDLSGNEADSGSPSLLRERILRDTEEALQLIRKFKGLKSFFFEKNKDRIQNWRKGAEYGWPEAQFLLGRYEQFNKNSADAVKWIRKASEQGYAQAQMQLYAFYRSGFGVSKDIDEGAKWLLKAAKQGHAASQYHLGGYHQRKGTHEDNVEAVKWYLKAARQGDDGAMFSLGICYHIGDGVSENKGEAIKWYRKAAEHGSSDVKKKSLEFLCKIS